MPLCLGASGSVRSAIQCQRQKCAEVFGFPGTSGPAGTRPIVAFLTGPTFVVRGPFVLDAGGIFDITGFGRTAVYGGLTWNVGRIWRQ